MDLRHLKNFVAIVDCGSLSKAAEKVYIAQPALSQQLAGLEGELRTQLLLRSSQGVVPTEAGKVLYRHARSLLRQIEQVRQEVAKPGACELGPVAIGLSSTMISVLALPLFERVRALHPGIRLHLFESMSGYLEELLAHGRLDMAIQFSNVETRGIGLQPLLEEDLYVIGSLPSREPAEVCELRELDGAPMVLGLSAQGLCMFVERCFVQAGLELNVIADVDSFRTSVAIASSGAACTVLPLSALMSLPEDERHRLAGWSSPRFAGLWPWLGRPHCLALERLSLCRASSSNWCKSSSPARGGLVRDCDRPKRFLQWTEFEPDATHKLGL